MAFNVDDFRINMVADGARACLFDIQLQIPFSNVGGKTIAVKVKAADLPGQAINAAPAYYFGREVKFAGNRVFQDWVVTILNDENFLIRQALEGWMDMISNTQYNVRAAAALPLDNGYATDAYVTQYGKAGDVLQRYKFVGIWPMDISAIGLDWGSTDQIEEFTCSFAVQYYNSLPAGVNASGSNIGASLAGVTAGLNGLASAAAQLSNLLG